MALPKIEMKTTSAADGYIESVTLVIRFDPPITEADLAAWLQMGIITKTKSATPKEDA